MKVKNLLLAGLAVAAMTACSNNDEIVDNNILPTTSEKANMQINFTFANAGTGTRGVTDGGIDAGENFEWNAANITVVLDYARGTKRIVTEDLKLVKTPAENDKVAQYTTEKFEVDASAEGEVTIYAFVNPSETLISKLQNANLATLAVDKVAILPTDLNYLIAEGQAAASNKFLMTGTAISQTLKPGDTTTVGITVSRVVAKLDEMTNIDEIYPLGASELSNAKAITVNITQHSYSNLSDDSYALKASTSIAPASYLQPYIAQGGTATKDSYKWVNAKATYCYENFGLSTPTRVHYVGQVSFDGTAIDNDFYVWARFEGATKVVTAYKNWAALKEAVSISDEFATNDQVLKDNYGVKRYKAGLCYYEAEILTAASEKAEIIRNNWYKLTVNSISELGTPDPVKPEDDKKAYLIVNANVEPWTVNINSFDL